MQLSERGFSRAGLVLAVAVFVGLTILYIAGQSGSGSSTGPNDALASDPQASTTLNQGVQLAKWLAKEYPAQGN